MWKRLSGSTMPRFTRGQGFFITTLLKPSQARLLSTKATFEKTPGEFLSSEPLLPLQVNSSYLLSYLRKQSEGLAPLSTPVHAKKPSKPATKESPIRVDASVSADRTAAKVAAVVPAEPPTMTTLAHPSAFLAGDVSLSTLLRGSSDTPAISVEAYRDLLSQWAAQRDALDHRKLQPATVEDFQWIKSIVLQLSPAEQAQAIRFMSTIPVSNVPVSPFLLHVLEKLVATSSPDREAAIRQALISLAARDITMTDATSRTLLQAFPQSIHPEQAVPIDELHRLLQSLETLGLTADRLTAEARRALIHQMAAATKLENRRLRFTETLEAAELNATRETAYGFLQTLSRSPCFRVDETFEFQYQLAMMNLEATLRLVAMNRPAQYPPKELLASMKNLIAYVTDHLPPTPNTPVFGDRRTRTTLGEAIAHVAPHLTSPAAWNLLIWTTLVELPLLTLVPDDTRLQLLAALHPRTLAKEADVKVTDMANVLLAAKHQWSMLPAPFQAAFVQAMTQQADADHRVLVKAFRLLPLLHFSLRCELPTDTRQSFLQMLQRKVARLNAEELESVLQGLLAARPGLVCVGEGRGLWKAIEKRVNALFTAQKWTFPRSKLSKIVADWGVTWGDLSPTSIAYFAPHLGASNSSHKTLHLPTLITEVHCMGLLRARWDHDVPATTQQLVTKSLRHYADKAKTKDAPDAPVWRLIDGFNMMRFAWHQDTAVRAAVETLVTWHLPTMATVDVAWLWQSLANSGAQWGDFSPALVRQLVEVTVQRHDLRKTAHKFDKYFDTDVVAVVLSSLALLGHDISSSASPSSAASSSSPSPSSSSSSPASASAEDERRDAFLRMLQHASTTLMPATDTSKYIYSKEHYQLFHHTWRTRWRSLLVSTNHAVTVPFIEAAPKDLARWSTYRDKMVAVTAAQLAATSSSSSSNQFTVRTRDDALFPKELALFYDFMLVRSTGTEKPTEVVLVKLQIASSLATVTRQERTPTLPHHMVDGGAAWRWHQVRRQLVQHYFPHGRCIEWPVTNIDGDGVADAQRIVALAVATV